MVVLVRASMELAGPEQELNLKPNLECDLHVPDGVSNPCATI